MTDNILFLGRIGLDHLVETEVKKLNCAASIPVCQMKSQDYVLDDLGQLAELVRVADIESSVFGMTGQDSYAQLVEALLNECGVTANLQICENYQVPMVTSVCNQESRLLQIESGESNHVEPDSMLLLGELDDSLQAAKLIVLVDGEPYLRRLWPHIMNMARMTNARVIVMTDFSCISHFPKADMVIVRDMQKSMFKQGAEIQLKQSIEKLQTKHEIQTLITFNNHGDIEYSHLPLAQSIRLKSAIKAPDKIQFIADLLVAQMQDEEILLGFNRAIQQNILDEHCEMPQWLQNVCSKSTYADNNQSSSQNIFDKLTVERQAGRRLVMAYGAFDMLHHGHLRFLREAKQYGDYLVVALFNDDLVKIRKGAMHPVQTIDERTRALQTLQEVDCVVFIEANDIAAMIKKIKPHCLALGNQQQEIAGYEEIQKCDGSIQRIAYFKHPELDELLFLPVDI